MAYTQVYAALTSVANSLARKRNWADPVQFGRSSLAGLL